MVQEAARSPFVVRFDSFEVNLRSGELHRNTEKLKLPEQSFQILGMLLEQAGEVVMRKDIQKRLWPNDTVVEFENSINAGVKKLRLALGDSADEPRYIETLARRGYRWMTPVEWVNFTPPAPQAAQSSIVESRSPSVASFMSGKRVAHYRVLEILGGGGMGVVYKAEDIKLGRRVALKFLPEELSSDAAAMKRFEREARAASALNHPNICTIYGVEEEGGQPFIAMELLEGHTLAEILAAGQSQKQFASVEGLIDVAIQIAEGLNAAHEKGIIHRDIKPANVFVTLNGQAKILDFGVAKLLAPDGTNGLQSLGRADLVHISNLNLTLTGLTIGTAGYMSPEQVQGEALDVRTDLFSFGLVLYEMATGQRAFTGDTAAIVHHAIVNDTPAGIRDLNPTLPRGLEHIVNKALQKDRNLRYQAASHVRDDLKGLKQELAPTPHASRRRKIQAATVASLLLVIGAIYWFSGRRSSTAQRLLAMNQRQLTPNSFENAVHSGGISPDGRYLAYRDDRQMYIKDLTTGESTVVAKPKALEHVNAEWDFGSWFPDSAKLLATTHSGSQQSSIWIIPRSGDRPRKLRDDAMAWSVSPDGTWIAFTTYRSPVGDREIWVMDTRGEQARKLYSANAASGFARVQFSPDGERLLFSREYDGDYNQNDSREQSIESGDLQGSPIRVVVSTSQLMSARPPECQSGCVIKDFLWLPDGRLTYVLSTGPVADTCNVWIGRLDPRTAAAVEKPHRLTSWRGSCMDSLSVTADGKRLAFRKWAPHLTSYVADLSHDGKRILHPRHFPLTESSDGVADWTPDNRAIMFVSNRSGRFGIYRQALDDDVAQPLVTEGYGREVHVTPDGKWVLYFGNSDNNLGFTAAAPVMRVPVSGGRSELVFAAKAYAQISCAKAPSTMCVVDEPSDDHKQAITTAFDPVTGRGPEVARHSVDPKQPLGFSAISPDGSRIAYTTTFAGPIYIQSLRGQPTREIEVKSWTSLYNLTWSADATAILVSADVRGGKALLRVNLQGEVNVLWEDAGAIGETIAVPSSDGRHLGMQSWTASGNMWMLENF
jgi:eukaryotic-like serine/threonine-protein kinase